jgi:hypothetical protein
MRKDTFKPEFPCLMVLNDVSGLAWPAMFVAMNSYINQHPLRLKEGGQAAVSLL